MIGNFANRCAQTGHGPKWHHVARAYAWRSLPAALALALCVLPDAHAQQNEDAPSDTEQTTLPAIVVTATRIPQSSFDVPAAVGVVTHDDIVDGAPAFSLSQSLARIPGVVALDRQS